MLRIPMKTAKELERKVLDTYEDLARNVFQRGYRHSPYYLARKSIVDWDLLNTIDISGKRVLNVGCFEPIDELIWAGLVRQWVAIDLSPASIDVARKIVKRELSAPLARRVQFKVMDAQSLKFPDNSFDAAVSFSVIDHIPDPDVRRRAIREMARVVRPHGHVIVTVPNWWGYFHIMHLRNERRGLKTDVGFQYFYSPRELKRELKDAGLTILRFTSDMKNVGDLPKPLRGLLMPLVYFGDRMGCLAQKH